MNESKQIYFSLFNRFNKNRSLHPLIERSDVKIIFPFYHVVSDEYLPHISNLYQYKNKLDFNNDLDFLLKYYKPLHIDDYINENYNKKENYFVLSFDDGLKEMYDIVFPILKGKGIPAIFFVNTSFIDNKELFYRYKVSLLIEGIKQVKQLKIISEFLKLKTEDISKINKKLLGLGFKDHETISQVATIADVDFQVFLNTAKPYMSYDELNELRNNGFCIGSHSTDHPYYHEMTEDQQKTQTKQGVMDLEKRVKQKSRYFAFPFTAEGVSENIFSYIFNELNIDRSFGTAGLRKNKDSHHIERIPMEIGNYTAKQVLTNEYAWYLLKNKLKRV